MGLLLFEYRDIDHIWKTCLVFAGLLVVLAAAAWISGVDLMRSGILAWPIGALFVIAFGRGFMLGSRRSGITLCILIGGMVLSLIYDLFWPHLIEPAVLALYVIASLFGGYITLLSINYLRTTSSDSSRP